MVGYAGSPTYTAYVDMTLTRSKVKVMGLLNFRQLAKPCMLAAMTAAPLRGFLVGQCPQPPFHPIFGPCLLWPNGWMDEDATWYGSRSRPRPHCVRQGPSSPPHKRGTAVPLFSALVCCGHGRPSQLLLSSCCY